MPKKPAKVPPGPKPERVKIEGNWEDAIGRAINTPKPKGGWPKPKSVPQRKRKS